MIWALAVATAVAACGDDLPEVDGVASVVWVSRLRAQTGLKRPIPVTLTADLVALVRQGRDVGGVLHDLGMRRTERTPRRPYKVVLFDVAATSLCRPMAGPAVAIAGVSVCTEPPVRKGEASCGLWLAKDGVRTGPAAFRGAWKDLAADGFCVLPLERWMDHARGGGAPAM